VEVLFRQTQGIVVVLSENGETKPMPNLTFRLPKPISAQATHVGLGVSDGRILWPIPTELKRTFETGHMDAARGSMREIDNRLTAEAEVYSRILRDPRLGGPSPRAGERTFVVVASTMSPRGAWWWSPPTEWGMKPFELRKRVPGAAEEVVEDFLRATLDQRDLSGSFGPSARVPAMPRARLTEIFQTRDGWMHFYSLYPSAAGYLEFSRVGFDEVGSQALVYVGHYYGLLGGTGRFVLLRWDGTEWNIVSWPHSCRCAATRAVSGDERTAHGMSARGQLTRTVDMYKIHICR